MRQLIAALILAASVLGLSACSNASGNGFVPTSQVRDSKPLFGYPYG